MREELNYRRAAERLFITQPALSTAIKQLEHQLGVMLFTRNTREVALTELGAAWLSTVRDALRGIDSAVDDLIALSAHYRRIRLGYLIALRAGHLEPLRRWRRLDRGRVPARRRGAHLDLRLRFRPLRPDPHRRTCVARQDLPAR